MTWFLAHLDNFAFVAGALLAAVFWRVRYVKGHRDGALLLAAYDGYSIATMVIACVPLAMVAAGIIEACDLVHVTKTLGLASVMITAHGASKLMPALGNGDQIDPTKHKPVG